MEPGQLSPLLGKQQIKQKYSTATMPYLYVGDAVSWEPVNSGRDLPACSCSAYCPVNKLPLPKKAICRPSTLRCPILEWNFRGRVTCPRCQFPGVQGEKDARISELESRLKICAEWEANILIELNNYRDNLQYLNENEAFVRQVLQKGKLEGLVSEQLVIALNNLFKELELVEFDPENLLERLFSGGQVIDYYTLERRLDEYKQQLIAGHDLDKVRIKLSTPEK